MQLAFPSPTDATLLAWDARGGEHERLADLFREVQEERRGADSLRTSLTHHLQLLAELTGSGGNTPHIALIRGAAFVDALHLMARADIRTDLEAALAALTDIDRTIEGA